MSNNGRPCIVEGEYVTTYGPIPELGPVSVVSGEDAAQRTEIMIRMINECDATYPDVVTSMKSLFGDIFIQLTARYFLKTLREVTQLEYEAAIAVARTAARTGVVDLQFLVFAGQAAEYLTAVAEGREIPAGLREALERSVDPATK